MLISKDPNDCGTTINTGTGPVPANEKSLRDPRWLGPWFTVQGLYNLDQVADYIIALQKRIADDQKRIDDAVAAEREGCAKIAETFTSLREGSRPRINRTIAAAIRAIRERWNS